MTGALAVLRYTLVEQTRRLVLIALLVIAVLLMVALGIAPLVIPGAPTGEARNDFLLNAGSSLVNLFTFVAAIGIGMTVLYNDLDGGGVVTIFAKPVTRLSYSLGKIGAAIVMLSLVVGVLAILFFAILRLNGGGHELAVAGYLGAQLANVLLFAVLVMALTVVVNNIVAAVIGFVFFQVIGAVVFFHTLVANKLIVNDFWVPIINVIYWLVPHTLISDLPREIVRSALARHPRPPAPPGARVFDPLSQIPAASGLPDVLYWGIYLVALGAILYLLVRRRQV